MQVITESGAVYEIKYTGKALSAVKAGKEVGLVIAVYPDRVPQLLRTVKVVEDHPFQIGYDSHGRQTCRFIPTQIRKGMILANRKGLRSTPIVECRGIL